MESSPPLTASRHLGTAISVNRTFGSVAEVYIARHNRVLSSGMDGVESDDLEWEEWNPGKLSFIHHMIAGSCAGLAEHVSIFPIDTLKTHVQCERCGSTSPMQTWNCATRIVGREGIFRLWRGVSAMFAGCIPGKLQARTAI